MYEINCLDSDGNTINNFTQWDVGQKLSIVLDGCDVDYLLVPPNVHFSNVNRKDALVVRSTVTNGDTITVSIPNLLLQESYPLLVYVYLTDSERVSSQKTILATEIPIRKRAKPNNYFYVENIERITAQKIKKEISEEISQGKTVMYYITYGDVITSTKHKVYVSNGKFILEDTKTPKSSTILDTRDKTELQGKIDVLTNKKADKTEIPTLPSQVGADASGTADRKIWEHNSNSAAHLDIRASIKNVDDKVEVLAGAMGGLGYMKIGNYTFLPNSDGHLTLVYTG